MSPTCKRRYFENRCSNKFALSTLIAAEGTRGGRASSKADLAPILGKLVEQCLLGVLLRHHLPAIGATSGSQARCLTNWGLGHEFEAAFGQAIEILIARCAHRLELENNPGVRLPNQHRGLHPHPHGPLAVAKELLGPTLHEDGRLSRVGDLRSPDLRADEGEEELVPIRLFHAAAADHAEARIDFKREGPCCNFDNHIG
mmetsp:Transcript_40797/g.115708  ORF Transcript_40797/g.115708 Transcript_40797/m.115708 type:complete len:200 (+) Transcript_40797:77-676(+)